MDPCTALDGLYGAIGALLGLVQGLTDLLLGGMALAFPFALPLVTTLHFVPSGLALQLAVALQSAFGPALGCPP